MANAAGAFKCYTAGGTASAMTITMDPALAAYSDKVLIWFTPPANNTGAFTVNVNGLGAVAVKLQDGTDPAADSVTTTGIFGIHHNGTNFRLLNAAGLTGLGVTASAAELNILDGVTATAAELNKTDDSAAAVAGFVSATRIYINTDGGDDSSFDIDANVTEGNWESVGPTGSGADNIWTAMDVIPAGARIAILFVNVDLDPTGTDSTQVAAVYIRSTGSSEGQTTGSIVINHRSNTDDFTGSSTRNSTNVFVPLDASRRFDINWIATGDTARSLFTSLKGFGL